MKRWLIILRALNINVSILSIILLALLVVNGIAYQSSIYFTNIVPLTLMVINLFIINKVIKCNKKKYEIYFLALFSFTFVVILLFLLLDIPLSIILTINLKLHNPFFWYNNISILFILGIIILIFVNWNFFCKNKSDDSYIKLFKDTYSILTLFTTLVVAIINVGFNKGSQLDAVYEFNIISIPLVGYLICSILEFIYKHALTIRDIKNTLKLHWETTCVAVSKWV